MGPTTSALAAAGYDVQRAANAMGWSLGHYYRLHKMEYPHQDMRGVITRLRTQVPDPVQAAPKPRKIEERLRSQDERIQTILSGMRALTSALNSRIAVPQAHAASLRDFLDDYLRQAFRG